MASQLHARRKHHDSENPAPNTIDDSNNSHVHTHDNTNNNNNNNNFLLSLTRGLKQSKAKDGTSEVRAAVLSVGAFLVVGMTLGYFLLHIQHRQVILHVMKNPWAHGGAVILKGRVGFQHHFYSGAPRYVTVVMPSVVNPKGRAQRLRAIQDTWGPYARSIFVVANATEFPPAQIHRAMIMPEDAPDYLPLGDPFSYPQSLLLPAEGMGEKEGIARLIYTITTVYERVNPDYAFFVNDHSYVIPEHLCAYLADKDPLDDLYAGHALKTDNYVFNSGAAGYLLSRSTMKRLVRAWHDRQEHCVVDVNDKSTEWLQGNPGLLTTFCLEKSFNITAIDTRQYGKYHRFHAFPLTRSVSGKVDQWYINKHTTEVAQKIGADESYATLLTGEDCCATDTITFHYVEHMEARALFATRERLLANPHMADKELKQFMVHEYPKNRQEYGFYSHPLPEPASQDEWTALLKTVRKISTRETQRDC